MHGMRKISGHFGTDDEELAQLVLAPPEALAVVSAQQSYSAYTTLLVFACFKFSCCLKHESNDKLQIPAVQQG